jgi:MFS family permease
MKGSISRNVQVLFLIKICQWLMLYMPVVKLFYAENHLGDTDLFLLHAIYSAVIFLVEIPSGYLADQMGRKNAIIIGLSFGLTGFLAYSFTYGFFGFLLAEVALGIGEGFVSGSDTALLYDTLLQQNKKNTYVRYEGRISGAGNLAESLAGIVVTLIAFSSARGYYYIQSGLSAIALAAAFFLTEPKVHGHVGEVKWKSVIEVVKNTVWKNRKLSSNILFSSLIGFSSLAMAWFAQIFLFQAGIPGRFFGIMWTMLNLMVAAGSFLSFRMENVLGKNGSLAYIILFIAGGYLMAAYHIQIYGILVLLVFYFVRGTAHPILKNRIHALTESKIRATVLSVRSLLIRVLFALLGPILGLLTEKISLSFALSLTGTIILIPGGMLVISMIRTKK